MLFGFARRDSVTAMFYELKLPTFKTTVHNAKVKMESCLKVHSNVLIRRTCSAVRVAKEFCHCSIFAVLTFFYVMFFCMCV